MLEIRSGDTVAAIDPKGGYITSLDDKNGALFFPRKIFTEPDGTQKVRGGSHVCLPNFGPGGESGLPQHGYGRISHWRPVFEEGDETFLVLDTGPGAYKKVRVELHYALKDATLEMAILAYNYGDTVVRFAPAFHPYFATAVSDEIKLDGKVINPEDYREAQFIEGSRHTLEINGRTLTLDSGELQTWAIWTDLKADYLCVEPTLAGNSFAEGAATDGELIRAGITRIYACTISW